MWGLYILMAAVTATVAARILHPVLRQKRGAVTQADKMLAATLAVLLPVASLVLYHVFGHPDLRGRQAIFRDFHETEQRHYALLARRPMTILVEQDPRNLGALLSLAKIHDRLDHYDDAEKFYRRAIAEAEAAQDMHLRFYAIALGELQIRANNGTVGDDALETFAYVRGIHAENPLARHYQALAKAQQGDTSGAIADWMALLNEGPTRAYWKKMVREEMATARRAEIEK